MPKDEFDFDDPLELNGVALFTEEDTSRDMAECFAEEFLRMGYNHKQVLALFRNPHYIGMNMVLQNKGEAFVREVIADTFARWGRPIQWAQAATSEGAVESTIPSPPESHPQNKSQPAGASCQCGSGGCGSAPQPGQDSAVDANLTDPMGDPIPKLD